MHMLEYLVALLTGLFAGILGALLGVSGGIIMLPANQFILGFEPAIAVGTALFAAVFTTSSGAYGHFRDGNVRLRRSLLIGCGGLIGVLLGSYIFETYLSSSTATLELLLGLLFLTMSFRMGQEFYNEWRHQGEAGTTTIKTVRYEKIKLLLLGFLAGTMAGVFGLGGGFILVPMLIWLFGARPYEAVGTTLLAMSPYVAAGGLIKLQQGFVNLPIGLLLGLGIIIGAQFGVIISRKVNPLIFKLVFALIFLYLSWQYLLA